MLSVQSKLVFEFSYKLYLAQILKLCLGTPKTYFCYVFFYYLE